MKASFNYHIVLNALLFQCCWFLAIFSQWYWALVLLLVMVGHTYQTSGHKWKDLKLCAVVSFSGITIDTLFKVSSIYTFGDELLLTPRSIPLWLCILWVAFSLTLNHSLKWLVSRAAWFVLGCAVAGPLSYIAGRSNGVINFSNASLVFISIEWIVIALLTLFLTSPSLVYKRMARRLQC